MRLHISHFAVNSFYWNGWKYSHRLIRVLMNHCNCIARDVLVKLIFRSSVRPNIYVLYYYFQKKTNLLHIKNEHVTNLRWALRTCSAFSKESNGILILAIQFMSVLLIWIQCAAGKQSVVLFVCEKSKFHSTWRVESIWWHFTYNA